MTIIASAAEFTAAIAVARGGETLMLAPGNYGSLNLWKRTFAPAVTIASADPARPAAFDDVTLNAVENIAFDAVKIGRPRKTDEPDWKYMNRWTAVKNVAATRCTFHGSENGTSTDDIVGLLVSDSDGITITGGTFTELVRGAMFQRSRKIVVNDNRFRIIRSDGIDFAACANVQIARNVFSDFDPQGDPEQGGDHADAIQFWTAGQTQGCSNVLIRDNLVIGAYPQTAQGILIQDEAGLRASGAGHRGFTISGNRVFDTMWWGIRVVGVDGLILNDNLASQVDKDTGIGKGRPVTESRIWVSECTGTVHDNSANALMIQSDGLVVSTANAKLRQTPDQRAAAIKAWHDAFDAPAAPQPEPKPQPDPVPPSAPPIDPAMRAAWQKAWDEQHAITLGSRRAETALKALADQLGVPKP